MDGSSLRFLAPALLLVALSAIPAASEQRDLLVDWLDSRGGISGILQGWRNRKSDTAKPAPPSGAPVAVPTVPGGPKYKWTAANEKLTPGKPLCSKSDPDFMKFVYKEQVAVCKRNITQTKMKEVSRIYNVAWENHENYEYDHRIPRCMGGSNRIENIWPQPIYEAAAKDVLEKKLCLQLRRGQITQRQAVEQMLAWPPKD